MLRSLIVAGVVAASPVAILGAIVGVFTLVFTLVFGTPSENERQFMAAWRTAAAFAEAEGYRLVGEDEPYRNPTNDGLYAPCRSLREDKAPVATTSGTLIICVPRDGSKPRII